MPDYELTLYERLSTRFPRAARAPEAPAALTRAVQVRGLDGSLMTVDVPTVESRFLVNFREPTTDDPGLVLTDAGGVYLIAPDGTRTQLPGGGGGGGGLPTGWTQAGDPADVETHGGNLDLSGPDEVTTGRVSIGQGGDFSTQIQADGVQVNSGTSPEAYSMEIGGGIVSTPPAVRAAFTASPDGGSGIALNANLMSVVDVLEFDAATGAFSINSDGLVVIAPSAGDNSLIVNWSNGGLTEAFRVGADDAVIKATLRNGDEFVIQGDGDDQGSWRGNAHGAVIQTGGDPDEIQYVLNAPLGQSVDIAEWQYNGTPVVTISPVGAVRIIPTDTSEDGLRVDDEAGQEILRVGAVQAGVTARLRDEMAFLIISDFSELFTARQTSGIDNLGFFGAGGVPQPAAPATLGDVIAGLQALGLFAL